MRDIDERILEYLREHDVGFPSSIADHPNFSVSEGTIRERCEHLAAMELVDITDGWLVELTMWGMLYLRGEVDAEAQYPESVQRDIDSSASYTVNRWRYKL